jgi:hypothetical protein
MWPRAKREPEGAPRATRTRRSCLCHPHLLDPVLGVDQAYLHAALEEMEERFGSIEGYFSQGLGIDEAGQEELRNTLTES